MHVSVEIDQSINRPGYFQRLAERLKVKPLEVTRLFYLVVGAFWIRVIGITSRDLWLDECLSIDQSKMAVVDVIARQAHGVHPPLFHVMTHYWMIFFGQSVFALRFLSVIFGLALVVIIYFIGRSFFDTRTGFTAALLVALSPFFIWYSQEVRMYMIFLVWTVLALFFGFHLLEKAKPLHWLLYVIFAGLMMYTLYFGAVLMICQNIYFLFWILRPLPEQASGNNETRKPSYWRKIKIKRALIWLSSQITVVMLFYPWARLVFLTVRPTAEYGENITAVQPPNFYLLLTVISQSIFGFHSSKITANLVSLWPLLLIVLFSIVVYIRPPSSKVLYLLIIAIGTVTFMYTIGFIRLLFVARYISVFTIPFYLLVSHLISTIAKRKQYTIVLLIISICFVVFWADQSFNPNNPLRYDNGKAVNYVERNLQPKDAIIYEPDFLEAVFSYYYQGNIDANNFPRREPDLRIRNSLDELSRDLYRVYKGKDRVWMVTSFEEIKDVRDDAIRTREILRNRFSKEEKKEFTNVKVYLYSE